MKFNRANVELNKINFCKFELEIQSFQCGSIFLLTTCLARKLNWRLLPKTCCSMFRRSQSIDFTCAALQAVRLLNICEICYGNLVPLNFLFKFTGDLVQLNINPVEFHLIRLCSFCNIYMSNDVKFFETPCSLRHPA